jgi:phospholipid/cholesterol/gamma-HCH transport system substrate-binding protein
MKINREFLIGVIAVFAIAVLYIGINYLKGVNFFVKKQEYYAVFDNAAGLTEANPVILNGFKVGIIKSVHLHENGSGKVVACVVINDGNLNIPSDSKFEIYDADFFGGKALRIVLGKTNQYVEDGDTLQSSVSLGLTESLKQEFDPIKQKTSQLFNGLDSMITNMNAVLGNGQSANLAKIFSSLPKTLLNLELVSGNLNDLVAHNASHINRILDNAAKLSSLIDDNSAVLTEVVANAKLITDSLAKANINETLRDAQIAINGFNELADQIKQGNGTAGKIIQSDELHTNLLNATNKMNDLLDDIKAHPKRYVSFSLFNKNPDNAEFTKKELEQMRKEIDKAILDREKQEQEGK